MEEQFELPEELYEAKKIVKATVSYFIDVNKDNVFISEVEDFDPSWQTQEDYDELKRTDAQLEHAATYELGEMIYNAIKYNEVADMIEVEIIDL